MSDLAYELQRYVGRTISEVLSDKDVLHIIFTDGTAMLLRLAEPGERLAC